MVTEFKFPKSMGRCADQLYALRQERLAQQKIVEKIEEQEKALKEYIIQNLPKSEATGAAGMVARVTIVQKVVAQVKDWDKFYEFIRKNKAYELLQRRLNDKAIQERWENKKQVAGVEPFTVTSISINKV